MSEWVIAVWLMGAGLFGGAGASSPAELVVCHVRAAVTGAGGCDDGCPCGEVCDEDAKDEDAKDEDVEDKDVCDGCDPDDEEDEDGEEE